MDFMEFIEENPAAQAYCVGVLLASAGVGLITGGLGWALLVLGAGGVCGAILIYLNGSSDL